MSNVTRTEANAVPIARLIDHTLLRATATESEITTLCSEAAAYGFATVCVNPWHVRKASELLQGASSGVCTVVGFPLGATLTSVKAFETEQAILNGATEVDMVLAVAALKEKRFALVRDDIRAVVTAAGQTPVKVILETCYLTDDEVITASELCVEAGASFVKTSTGFGTGGATVPRVTLMRQTVGDALGVKASGGIRDLKTARAMIAAGANRLGCSAGVAIVGGLAAEGGLDGY